VEACLFLAGMGDWRWDVLLALASRMERAARAFQVAVVDTALAALKRGAAALPVDIDMVYVVVAALASADLENYQALTYLADRGPLIPGMGRCNEPVVLAPHRRSYLASQILLYYYACSIDEYIIARSISIHIGIRKCCYDLAINMVFTKEERCYDCIINVKARNRL
jgi:hypothetical protein